MKISIYTLGCKLNQTETVSLKSDLENQGFLSCEWGQEDIAIVRACGVTCGASATTREMIRQAKRRGSYVIAVGCLENKDLKEIDFVSHDNYEIVEHLLQKFGEQNKNIIGNPLSISPLESGRKTRALVKIQTGCNFACTYCIITKFRGNSKSKSPEEIIKKIKELEKNGFKEVTLTGVNICQYCDNTPLTPLKRGIDSSLQACGLAEPKITSVGMTGLLKLILEETKIERIRLGSLDPRLITDELIKLYTNQKSSKLPPPLSLPLRQGEKTERLLPHWHLSLQSGSDKILKGMARGYTQDQYFEIIKKLRDKNPLFSFTTDIIVGFPEETEEDFKQTVEFVKKCEFTKVHVFPYSKRPGTVACEIENQVQDSIKKERVKELIKIADQTGEKFKKKFISLERPVLFESKKDGFWTGFTPEYIRVRLKSNNNLENQIKNIELTMEVLDGGFTKLG